jgi:hypothetical protein
MRAEKARVCVFAIFLAALLIFAIVYRPVNAISRPADQNFSSSTPTPR